MQVQQMLDLVAIKLNCPSISKLELTDQDVDEGIYYFEIEEPIELVGKVQEMAVALEEGVPTLQIFVDDKSVDPRLLIPGLHGGYADFSLGLINIETSERTVPKVEIDTSYELSVVEKEIAASLIAEASAKYKIDLTSSDYRVMGVGDYNVIIQVVNANPTFGRICEFTSTQLDYSTESGLELIVCGNEGYGLLGVTEAAVITVI